MADLPLSVGLTTALKHGAEIGLARAIASGAGNETVTNYIQARLGNLLSTEVAYIRDLANAMLESGDYLNNLEPDEQPDPELIPTNQGIDTTDWDGGRLRWFGQWNIPGEEEWYNFSGTLPDISDFGDITSAAFELASGWIDQYPDRFKGTEDGPPDELNIKILGWEKGF